jgi:uncharacterized membrane protein
LQAPLAIVGAPAAWRSGCSAPRRRGRLALLLGAVVPFTLVVIKPTNARLLSATPDRGSEQAHALLTSWNTLHAVRTVLSLAALVIMLICAVG